MLNPNEIVLDSEIYFRPTQNEEKHYSEYFQISCRDSGEAQGTTESFILSGSGVETILDWIPEDLNFGTIHFSDQIKTDPLTLQNTSKKYWIWIDGLIVSDTSVFTVVNFDSFSLCLASEPGCNKKVFDIQFHPPQPPPDCYPKDSLIIKYRWGNEQTGLSNANRPVKLSGCCVDGILQWDAPKWKIQAPIGTTAETSFVFKNTGNIPIYYQFLSPLPVLPFKHEYDTSEDSIPAFGENTIKVKFTPSDTCTSRQSFFLKFWEKFPAKQDRDSIRYSIPLTGRGQDFTPPQIEPTELTRTVIADWHKPLELSFITQDSFSGIIENSVKIWLRKGGEMDFRQGDGINLQDSVFQFSIPKEYVTSRGIEYFVEAGDGSIDKMNYGYFPFREKPAREDSFKYCSIPVQIPAPGLARTKDYDDFGEIEFFNADAFNNDYRFVSIPFQLDAPHDGLKILRDSFDFGDFLKHRWQCIDYQFNQEKGINQRKTINNYNATQAALAFSAGKSVLLLVEYQYPQCYLKRQPGTSLRSDTLFFIPLERGWNFISNPFNFRIPLNQVSRGNELYRYQGKWQNVKGLNSSEQNLMPWEGYAIYSSAKTTINLCPNLNSEFGPTQLVSALQKVEYAWSVSIRAEMQDEFDDANLAVVNEAATMAADQFDVPKPPVIDDNLILAFKHPEWDEPEIFYSTEVQPPNESGNVWDFYVSSRLEKSKIQLTFSNLSSVPEASNVYLICDALNLFQDLRVKNNITYPNPTPTDQVHFKILVGTNQFIAENKALSSVLPKDYALSINFPNPFTHSTTIEYTIPRQDLVTIEIYNILGHLVKKIEKKSLKPAGQYQVLWDGLDESGEMVGNGTYFCKLSSSGFSKTIKMIHLR
jgi:hypothetical protein